MQHPCNFKFFVQRVLNLDINVYFTFRILAVCTLRELLSMSNRRWSRTLVPNQDAFLELPRNLQLRWIHLLDVLPEHFMNLRSSFFFKFDKVKFILPVLIMVSFSG